MAFAENDSNTLRVDAKIFASAKKYLRKQKSPHTCGHGLSFIENRHTVGRWLILTAIHPKKTELFIY